MARRFLLASLLLTTWGCGDAAEGPADASVDVAATDASASDAFSEDREEPSDAGNEDTPDGSSDEVFWFDLRDHQGSLYSGFRWAGPRREPMRDELEIHDAFIPLSDAAAASLQEMLRQRDVIAQIGGMGSAKPNPDDPNAPSPRFAGYMDRIAADDGATWREWVAERAHEVAALSDEDDAFYWQIGNEISAPSYSQNIHLYFDDGRDWSGGDLEIIPVYVEWFFAPTVQAFEEVSAETGRPIRVASGSTTNYRNRRNQAFLGALLDYEIEGTYAPALAGRRVAEFVDIITVHYLMNGSEPDEPEYWRPILDATHERWIGRGRIRGIWATEEIGIRAAMEGAGARSSLRIAARYMSWLSDHRFAPDDVRWFYYAANVGPTGEKASDALNLVADFLGGARVHLSGRSIRDAFEISEFAREGGGSFAVLSVHAEASLSSLRLHSMVGGEATLNAFTSAGATEISGSLVSEGAETLVHFEPLELSAGDTVLLRVE